jgi:hypothetical protein
MPTAVQCNFNGLEAEAKSRNAAVDNQLSEESCICGRQKARHPARYELAEMSRRILNQPLFIELDGRLQTFYPEPGDGPDWRLASRKRKSGG